MSQSSHKIKKMLPKVRAFIHSRSCLFSVIQTWGTKEHAKTCFSVCFCDPFLLKTYMRKHVAHEIYSALTHFKDLDAVMDRYGEKHSLHFTLEGKKSTLTEP